MTQIVMMMTQAAMRTTGTNFSRDVLFYTDNDCV